MRATTFDTLEYMMTLKNAGMTQEVAEGMTKAFSKAFDHAMDNKELATKTDLKNLELSAQKERYDIKINLQKEINDMAWRTIGILATFQTVTLSIFGIIQYFLNH